MPAQTKVRIKIVDADGHYVEPPHDIPKFIDPKYEGIAPRVVKRGDKEFWEGKGWWLDNPATYRMATGSIPATAISGLAGVERWNRGAEIDNVKNLNYTQMNPAALQPSARLTVLDTEHIDAVVLYPTFNLQWIADGEYHQAVNRALNDWLGQEYIAVAPQRMYGAVNIGAIHDVEWACAEVRRCVAKYGFKAVYLRMSHAKPDARWFGEQYDALWATCQELDVAVGFHPYPGDTMYGSSRYFDMIGPSAIQQFARGPLNHPVDAMNVITGLISGGILERFPSLRFAILESSGGWLVSLLERLDHRFEHLGHVVPHLKMKPSDYFRRQGWISFDPDEAPLALTARWLGADRIIWGSDFPHPDAFYPNFIQMLNGQISELTSDEQDRIRGLNARDFYKL